MIDTVKAIVGHTYRIRQGGIGVVVRRNFDQTSYPFSGYTIYRSGSSYSTETWRENGRYRAGGDENKSDEDLVEDLGNKMERVEMAKPDEIDFVALRQSAITLLGYVMTERKNSMDDNTAVILMLTMGVMSHVLEGSSLEGFTSVSDEDG